jgi:hypothetical protein
VALLALHHAPSWTGPAAAIGSLIPIPVLILEKAWPSWEVRRHGGRNAAGNAPETDQARDRGAPADGAGRQSASRAKSPQRSFAFGHVCLTLLAGLCVPLALAWLISYLHSGSSVSAGADITSSDDTGVTAGATVTFTATVPLSRSLLTISFAAQQAAEGSDNCINGATLGLAEKYGSTVAVVSRGKRLGASYTIPVPPGVGRFQLLVTFNPQPGFSYCSEDISVAAAQFHS